MEEEQHPYRASIAGGAIVLFLAAAIDVAVEWRRAVAALQGWICGTTPTPSGPEACANAFLLRWMTSHLPLYALGVSAAALVAGAIAATRRAAGGWPRWNAVLRTAAMVVCVLALSELIACAGDATCGLSVSCT